MSIKSTAFVAASLVLVWGLHSYPVQADYTPESPSVEDQFEQQDAMRDMKSLFDLPSGVEFPSQSPALFEKVEKNSFSRNLSDIATQEQVKDMLKDQDLMGTQVRDLMMLPVISEQMVDDYLTLTLAQRIGFSPETMPKNEGVTWGEKIGKFFSMFAYPDADFGNEMVVH